MVLSEEGNTAIRCHTLEQVVHACKHFNVNKEVKDDLHESYLHNNATGMLIGRYKDGSASIYTQKMSSEKNVYIYEYDEFFKDEIINNMYKRLGMEVKDD